MQILLANPRGFCAGVDRAISIVEQALTLYGAPVYVRHEIVHNRSVVQALRQRGVVFVEQLKEVPAGAIVIFSAHGVAQAVRHEANMRGLTVFDATCPLVTKVHMQVARASRFGTEVILIGHRNHPEVTGTLGQYNNPQGGIYLIENMEQIDQLVIKDENNLCFVTQTTLSVEDTAKIISALQVRFPKIVGPRKDDICYATTNRQAAVRDLAMKAAVVLIMGSQNSSNSNRLAELVQRLGKPAYLIDSAEDIQPEWVDKAAVVGIAAGASAPESLVQAAVERLRTLGGEVAVEVPGCDEGVIFPLPKALQKGVIREQK